MINPVDGYLISHLNHLARRSWAFDNFFVLCSNYLLRAAGIVPLYWWAWFDKQGGRSKKRETLTFGLIACVFALFLSRLIAAIGPFRIRPIHNPELHFQAPYGQGTQMLIGWNAFPSDHAAVYFTLATCLCFVSRRLGVFALCWAFFVTSLPRVYLGLHYPTDILAGALLGIGVAWLARVPRILDAVTLPVLKWEEAHPGPFYAFFFLFTLQLATALESVLLLRDYLQAVGQHTIRLLH